LQPGPQEDLNHCNWVLGSSGQRGCNSPAKFRRRWSPATRGKRLGRIRGLGRPLLGVMCRAGLGGGGGTVVNRCGGNVAQPWRRCSGVMAHRRWTRGWAGAQGKQDGSVKHLVEGRGGWESRSPW
jgi:hypothetical protein